MTATFGEFLDRAASCLSGAAGVRDLPSSTVIASAVQLRRFTTAVSRYVADPRTFPAPAEATTAGVRLYQAAGSLRRAAEAGAGLPGPGAAHPLPQRIGNAASALTAGLDLLATHFTTGNDGVTRPRSHWAATLATPPARTALLAELSDLAVLAASACRALGQVPSPALPRASRDALLAASSQLASIPPASREHHDQRNAEPVYRQLLHAVPAAMLPPREPAGAPEGLADLSEAVSLSAERMRSLIWQPPDGGTWPPPPTLMTWRWSAHAAAIASHISEPILTGLAERARQLMPGPAGPALSHAAIAMGTSWNAWRHVASASAMLSDTVAWNIPPPVRDDLTDLIDRLGRIAYANPAWTPAASQRAPLKSPAELAPGPDELRMVLAAVHHTADTLTRLAAADLAAVQAAVGTGKIRQDTSPAYSSLSMPGRVSELPRLYELTRDAANRVTEAIDLPAITTSAPSSYLAVMRSAPVPSQASTSEPALDPDLARFRVLDELYAPRNPDQVDRASKAASLWRASFPGRPMPSAEASPARRPRATPPQARHPRAIP